MARFTPTARGRCHEVAASGEAPTFTCASTNAALRAAITRSEAIAKPRPAPAAVPCTLAITGWGSRCSTLNRCALRPTRTSKARWRSTGGSSATPVKLRTSPPAMKWPPAPLKTMQRTDRSNSARKRKEVVASSISGLAALRASGRMKVRRATPSSTEIRRSSLSKGVGPVHYEPYRMLIYSRFSYANRPEATARAVVDGWYRTGDGGYVDADGYLYLTDRLKDMVITGGKNVYPVEVENALKLHPMVKDAAVVGTPKENWGETVAAIVDLRPGERPSFADLHAFCRERIAGYKCPRPVYVTTGLPRTPSGKVQRGAASKNLAGLERLA